VIGNDGAGFVAAKGPRVRRFGVGDRVWAYEWANPKGGFYAEYVAVDAEHVGVVPRRLDLQQAGDGVERACWEPQRDGEHKRWFSSSVPTRCSTPDVRTQPSAFRRSRRKASLAGAAAAHQRLERDRVLGRIALVVRRSNRP
jgi:hypothetical protein